jgi:uncharacterized protein YkuJ
MIRNTVVAYKTRNELKKDTLNRSSIAYEKANSFGILYTAEDLKKHDEIKALVRKFEKDGKKVDVLSFLPKDVQNFEFRYTFFTDKDISMFANFKSSEVVAFTEKAFDYLLYFDFESDPIMRYILAKSAAKCRVGNFEEANRPFCDLMVAPQQPNYKSLAFEMYKYTKILS